MYCMMFYSLGSTRFFKVAKATSKEGLVVVKVFVLHDLSLLLQPYQQRIEDIKLKLASAFNCLPFRKAIVSAQSNNIVMQADQTVFVLVTEGKSASNL